MKFSTGASPYPICVKCGEQAFIWVVFGSLEGMPIVCERCVFESITGERREYADDVKEYMARKS